MEDADLATVTADDVVVGTSGYLAPEQLRRQELGPRTDVWALAVLMYRAVTGLMPFRGSQAEVLHRTLEKHPAEPSTFRKDLPRAAERAILWGLNKRPEDRAPSVIDLARAFAHGVGAPFFIDQAHVCTVPSQPAVVIRSPPQDADVTVAAVPQSLAFMPAAADETVPAAPPPSRASGRPRPRRPSNAVLVAFVAALSALAAGVSAYLAVGG